MMKIKLHLFTRTRKKKIIFDWIKREETNEPTKNDRSTKKNERNETKAIVY